MPSPKCRQCIEQHIGEGATIIKLSMESGYPANSVRKAVIRLAELKKVEIKWIRDGKLKPQMFVVPKGEDALAYLMRVLGPRKKKRKA